MTHPNQNLDLLDQLVVNLNIRWKLYRDLFQSEEQIGIFSESGPGVWEVLHECTLDAIFMEISRLMDPSASCGHTNLSFEYVLQDVPRTGFTAKLDNQLAEAKELYVESIKPWRDRRLGHNDLDTLAGKKALPDVPYSQINDIMDKINKIAKCIALTVWQIDQQFVPAIPGSQWTPRLFLVLKAGVEKCKR